MIGVTAHDILTSSGAHDERLDWVSPAVERNAHNLAPLVTALLLEFGEMRPINSGFRDITVQRELVKQKKTKNVFSWHLMGQAVDLSDPDGRLGAWALVNEAALAELGLYAEHPEATNTKDGRWLHVQTVPPPSGRRIFRP